MTTYRLPATALCPVDGSRDYYEVELKADRIIDALDLRSWFDAKANTRIFQEQLARDAQRVFGGAVVVIRGQHPSTVEVTT